MAEAFLNKYGGENLEAESAGLDPGTLNPLVVKAMAETGIDISGNQTNSVFEFFKEGRLYSYVITVCDESAEARCPIFPGITKRLGWAFDDPSALTGTDEEKMQKIREIRDGIKEKVLEFIKTMNN